MTSLTTHRVPFGQWETWTAVFAPDLPVPGALPLIVLHGGPGMAHNYLKNLEALTATGRTVILYDQLGCGNSSHLPDAHDGFWVPELFVDEFHNLLEYFRIGSFHLLGQSWGGMLGAEIAVRQPSGLASLSICNSPASMELWAKAAAELRKDLPREVRDALALHEKAGTLTSPEYLAATMAFYERHVCRISPLPADFEQSVAQMEAEPTVYHTMNGPNEFHVIGTLRDWSVIDRLHLVRAPTLIVAGEFDEATPATWAPFITNIPKVDSHVFPGASHCTHLEQPEEFQRVIAAHLARHDQPRHS
ncbi:MULTISPECIES: proline iminopeptidase-family hydrolase [unclassified Arthrobacter]|uniref:proline iminopeptidase-family hydrolase n=1 Tax=unclassified Arthrobacter TaxID=235627 RepID=UPI001CFF5EA2|nr:MULTISPECIES: proline iminopeptidase-family hydrolase [unclassified Arthrobacter]MCB5282858.1 L-amino acid amidase [Arthrobacter sp. ES1]WGZ78960.1 proline iminopeptidase-family hydrolase [Arthrobacter sp. EM1]